MHWRSFLTVSTYAITAGGISTSIVFCTQYSQKDWHQRLGSGVHADAIMDRIIYNTIWVETGTYNMREHTALAST